MYIIYGIMHTHLRNLLYLLKLLRYNCQYNKILKFSCSSTTYAFKK